MTAPVMPLAAQTGPGRVTVRFELVRALLRHRSGIVGVGILTFFTVLAIIPNLLVGDLQTAVTATGGRLEPPSAAFPLGTDELGRSMLNLVVHATRISMVIGLLATVVTVGVGAVLGIVSGYIGGRFDDVAMRIADFFLVMPTFVLALILTSLIRDVLGTGSKEIAGIRLSLLVIVIVIGITSWSSTARAKGLTEGRILRSHALPNALLPTVSLVAINLGYVVAGAITVEVVFNWPGLGTLTVEALSARDYPVLQGIFLLLSVTVVLANLAADLLYGLLDPRVRT